MVAGVVVVTTEQGRLTRDLVVATATVLFGRDGYDATSTEEVLRETGISRGSLYHHFPFKERLFLAVLDSVEADVLARLVAARDAADEPLAGLRAGARAWVEAATDPGVCRILLVEAPIVLGWARWRVFDEKRVLRVLTASLQGLADPALVDLFAHVLLAGLNEIALVVVRTGCLIRGLAAAEALVDGLVAGRPGA